MNAMIADTKKKLAGLMLYNLSDDEISEVLGLSVARVALLKDDEDVREMLAELKADKFDEKVGINEAWNFVESASLGVLVDTIQNVRDPEFALKAAAVANKAVRKNVTGRSNLIDATDAPRAVITLTQVFINRLQQYNEAGIGNRQESIIKGLASKAVDSLSPKQVENALLPESMQGVDLNKLTEDEMEKIIAPLVDYD